MILNLLFTITLSCTSPDLAGTTLNTTHGPEATALLEVLPRHDSTAWFAIGTLYANRIFMMESKNKREDADSALAYLQRARALCDDNAVIAAYETVALGLRAKEDGWFRKISGKTTRQAHSAFVRMDSLRLACPDNLAVQFLSACMFRNAPKQFSDSRAFQLTSYATFQTLHQAALREEKTAFFTPDVHSHILVSLAILVEKLENDRTAEQLSCEYIQALLEQYPQSPAATYARTKKLPCA